MRSGGYVQHSPAFQIALWGLKITAIIIGLPLSIVCLMASVALLTDSLWVQLIPALLVAAVLPSIAAERLGRDDRGRRREGLGTDVLAAVWLGFALIFIVGALPVTRHLLLREAEIFDEAEMSKTASVVSWLARGGPLFPQYPIEGIDDGDGVDDSEGVVDSSSVESEEVDDDAGVGDAGMWERVDAEPGGDVGGGDAEAAIVEEELPELGRSELAKAIAPTLVTISVRRNDKTVTSATGVVITAGGEILTAASVVRQAVSIAVKTHDGRWFEQVAISGVSDVQGLALLSLTEDAPLTPARLGDEESYAVGERVFVFGNSLGLSAIFTGGELIESLEISGRQVFRLSAPITMGHAGGPVVTSRGEVIGVAQYARLAPAVMPLRRAPPGIAAPVMGLDDLVGRGVENQQSGVGDTPPLTW